MPTKRASEREHAVYHKDGSVWVRGKTAGGMPAGYWEWFRKDGTKLRSGHFENGEHAGEWITHDRQEVKCKVTNIKPKPQKRA